MVVEADEAQRRILASIRGAFAAATDPSADLGAAARRYGYRARTAEGDAFELAFEWAREERDRACRTCQRPAHQGACADPDFNRAGGGVTCEACGRLYYDHPPDRRRHALDAEGRTVLRVLCDGRRVKL